MPDEAVPVATVTTDVPVHRHPHFFKQFFAMAGGYWTTGRPWKAWGLTVTLVVLSVATVGIQMWINFWNKDFFDTLERKDWTGFYGELWMFGLIILASVATTAVHLHVKRKLQLGWRQWLSTRTVDRWLDAGHHYKLQFMPGSHDNPDGRIAEDTRIATEMAVEFAHSILYCVLLLISFLGILWNLSGAFTLNLGGREIGIPGYMVWVAIAYAAVGSGITFLIGRPLVAATDERQSREADFRFGLVRARENAEGIALLRGEADERRRLLSAFTGIQGAWNKQTQGQRRLMMLTTAYGTLAGVFPILVAAPQYFVSAITLGGLMQTAQAFLQVQSALSWFVDNFPRFAEWNASVERVLDLHDALDELEEETGTGAEPTIAVEVADAPDLAFDKVTIAHPDGTVLVNDATAALKPGERVLIKGESGSGKSTLFRAVAGLWPWGHGQIRLPASRKLMFLPQRPYLPIDSLRAALLYPDPPDSQDEEALIAALAKVGLEHLVERLDEVEQWDHVLSGGEQQRLAFARVLLQKPDWVFLDEATAALDEVNQELVMHALIEALPDVGVLSIGHRPGMEAFHHRELVLLRTEDGARLVRGTRERRDAVRKAKEEARQRRQRVLRRLTTGLNPHPQLHHHPYPHRPHN
ncbi:MAG: ABC transporter ATP-binding protein/permease [Rhodospirillales bacterium]